MSANSQFQYFGAIINAQKESPNPYNELERLQQRLLTTFDLVASIIHDKDKDKDNLLKRPHLHVFFELREDEKTTRKKFLAELSTLLCIDKVQISLEESNNQFLLVQYLTHKNQPDKLPYDYSLIKATDLQWLKKTYEHKYEPPKKTNAIQEDLMNCKTLLQFMDRQGIDIANKYKQLFAQIKKDQSFNPDYYINKANYYYKVLEQLQRIVMDPITQTRTGKELAKAISDFIQDNIFYDEEDLPF